VADPGADHEIRTERWTPNGVELSVTLAGEGPLVVLLHGFPELAYSWRHQIRTLARAGYRVVAPDMRGYGASGRPDDITDYDIFHLAGDVTGLIRLAGGGPAVVVGHDWGAILAWAYAQFRPDLLAGVVAMSVPFTPPLDLSLIDVLKARFADHFHYILYFQEPGVAEQELEADPLFTLRHLLWRASGAELPPVERQAGDRYLVGEVPEGLPDWLSRGDFDAYGQAFLRSGFTGPVNWYRNMHRNWELMAPWRHGMITIPAAFIAGTRDGVLTATARPGATSLDDHPMLAVQRTYCPDVQVTLIEGGGHWIQQEKPDEVDSALLDFLAGLDLGTSR
jgi:pimeloyl-ACP methyl ester carboxylesterase